MNIKNDSHEHDHSHGGDCSHAHEHCHMGGHNHTHDQDNAPGDEKDRDEKTLKILLKHWIEHNKSHEDSFSEWIGKAKDMGKTDTSQYIEKAVKFMEQADEMLKKAEEHM
jgi:hypothetical protein